MAGVVVAPVFIFNYSTIHFACVNKLLTGMMEHIW